MTRDIVTAVTALVLVMLTGLGLAGTAVAVRPTPAPVVATVAPAPAPALPECTSEDGSDPGQAFPCVWDASTRGNGQGRSFTLAAPICDDDQVAASDAAHRDGRPDPVAGTCDDAESAVMYLDR